MPNLFLAVPLRVRTLALATPAALFTALLSALLLMDAASLTAQRRPAPPPLYLNLVWNLETSAQPTDFTAAAPSGGLPSPTLRHNATSRYLELAGLLADFPDLSFTVNFPAETVVGIERYTARLGEFIDLKSNQLDAAAFLRKYDGQTDAWLELLLRPAAEMRSREVDLLINNSGTQDLNAFSVSAAVLRRFPEYAALMPSDMKVGDITGTARRQFFSVQDRLKAKFFFAAAHFDTRLLRGKVDLPPVMVRDSTGALVPTPISVDLSDFFLIETQDTPDESDDAYILRNPIGEDDCRRLAIETYKVMQSLVPLYRSLASGAGAAALKSTGKSSVKNAPAAGRVELTASAATGAILPLLINTDAAKESGALPFSPVRFAYPGDAARHLDLGVAKHALTFGKPAAGIVPPHGAVSRETMGLLADAGAKWTLTGKDVLAKSLSKLLGQANRPLAPRAIASPYLVKDAAGRALPVFFAETAFSDAFRAAYPYRTVSENVRDFFESLKKYAPSPEDAADDAVPPVLTIVIDYDELWSASLNDVDGKLFFRTLFEALRKRQPPDASQSASKKKDKKDFSSAEFPVKTVTPTEFLSGSKARGIAVPPGMPVLNEFVAGAFGETGFKAWIGDEEEKSAWSYLALVRSDVARLGLTPPTGTQLSAPANFTDSSRQGLELAAWRHLFAAEAGEYFRWYGDDADALAAADARYDAAFRQQLNGVYSLLAKAGYAVERRALPPIIQLQSQKRPVRDMLASRVKIDGLLNEADWLEYGGFFLSDAPDLSSSGGIRRCYYGFDDRNLFLALDGGALDLEELLDDTSYSVRLTLNYEKNRTTILDLNRRTLSSLPVLAKVSGSIIELQIPYTQLSNFGSAPQFMGLQVGQEKTYRRSMYLGVSIEAGRAIGTGNGISNGAGNGGATRMPTQGFYTLIEDRTSIINVVFEVDASDVGIREAIYIAGDRPALGGEVPNKVRLYDNGTGGDRRGNDKVWTRTFQFRIGETIRYKYSNSGKEGDWGQSAEFDGWRTVIVQPDDLRSPDRMIVQDFFGRKLR